MLLLLNGDYVSNVRLAAVVHFYFGMWPRIGEYGRERFLIDRRNMLASKNGEELGIRDAGTGDGPQHDIGLIVSGGGNLVVDETDRLSFNDGDAIDFGGSYCPGDAEGDAVPDHPGHFVRVAVEIVVDVEGSQCGERGGDRVGGDNAYGFPGQRVYLVCVHDDVPVVGKEDDVVGVQGFDGVEQLFGAGIHGVSTMDDEIGSERTEGRGYSGATGNGDNGNRCVDVSSGRFLSEGCRWRCMGTVTRSPSL